MTAKFSEASVRHDVTLRLYKVRCALILSALGIIAVYGLAVWMLFSENAENARFGELLVSSIASAQMGFLASRGK